MYVKLTLRLEKEERARVKVQEQMARLQQENLRLKSQERQRRLMEPARIGSSSRQSGAVAASSGYSAPDREIS